MKTYRTQWYGKNWMEMQFKVLTFFLTHSVYMYVCGYMFVYFVGVLLLVLLARKRM